MAASHTHDDGFREIQLNGKQLVFLFMAVTVVSVVIFLCGVLVGRNVRVEQQRAVAQAAALNDVPAPDVVSAISPGAAAAAQSGGDPTKAAPPPQPADDLSYFDRLEKSNRSADDLKATPSKSSSANSSKPSASSEASNAAAGPLPDVRRPTPPAPARPPTDKPATDKPATEKPAIEKLAAEKPPAPVVTAPAPPSTPAPVSDGYAVQVAAVNVRGDADAIVKRLTSKGYAAYVQVPPSGAKGSVFRVRVGSFKTRREADAVAARLQKEEQIKPWVTR